MTNEGVEAKRIESVCTVVAHVAVKGKHSFAAPTTRATAVITIVRKLNRSCVIAPIGLITECIPSAGPAPLDAWVCYLILPYA